MSSRRVLFAAVLLFASVSTSLFASVQKANALDVTLTSGGGANAYPTPAASPATPVVACPNISIGLAQGSRGPQVLELQKFIAGYYKISPRVIQTGTFGPTTGAYVKALQKKWGISPSGGVGSQMRAAIAKRCRASGTANTQNATTTNTFTPTVTSIDPTSGPVGTKVYINGTGFGGDNTVNFSDAHFPGIVSSDGSHIVFTVPNYNPDSYGISVTSPKWGTTSNVTKFILTSGNTQKLPMVSQVVPSTASVGESISVRGTGFTATDNVVNFGQYSFGSYVSLKDGTVIVPDGVTSKMEPGTYSVSVRNANGDSRDATIGSGPSFTLLPRSGGGGGTSAPITLSSATVQGPTSPTDNVRITIYGTNLKYQSQVYFGGTKCNTLATYTTNPESLTTQVDANMWYNSCGGSSPIEVKAQSTDGSYSNVVVGNATSPYTPPPSGLITISSLNIQSPPIGSPGTVYVTIFGTNLSRQSQVYFGNCNTLANYTANPESLTFQTDASFFYNSCQGNSPTIEMKVKSTDGSFSNTKAFPQVSL